METENTNLQSNPAQASIQNEPNQRVINDQKSNFLLILGAIFLIVVVGVIGYIFYKNNSTSGKKAVSQENNSSNNISQPSVKLEQLPKLAYIETFGIAVPDDKSPDLGRVFVLNSDGTDKKLLYKFDRADLVNVPGFPLYSPNTHEIIKNTKKGIVAIDINTSKVRNLYEAKSNNNTSIQSASFVMSDDKNSIYITSYDVTQGGSIVNTKKYKVSLTDRNNPPQEISSYTLRQQPYFDSRSGKDVEVNVKDSTVGGAGTFINSSEIIVTNTSLNSKKSFIYDKPGEIEPLFITSNYFYFKVNQCCASTDRLPSMTQFNLDTGEFSSPSSIPEITQKLANTNLTLENKGISPDGMYYVYSAVNNLVPNNGDIKTYLYNTNTKQEIELNVGVDSFINWSSDSKFVLFNYNEPSSYIYNIDSKNLKQTKIPSSTNYIILK